MRTVESRGEEVVLSSSYVVVGVARVVRYQYRLFNCIIIAINYTSDILFVQFYY